MRRLNYYKERIIFKEKEREKLIYLFLALAGVLLSYFASPPNGLSHQGFIMLAITLAAAFLWITETVPLGVTALIIIFLEALTGVMPLSAGLSFLAHPVNALVMVGFLLAAILVKSGLDIRIGLVVISKMGEKTERIILGLMFATAFLSMWMSNTAATAIMLPIALGILGMAGAKPLQSNFGRAMIIGIAYSSNIGGMATPVGTPANSITIAFIDSMAGIKVSFLDWMIRALPVVLVLLPLAWLILIRMFPLELKEVKGGLGFVNQQLKEKGALTMEEKKVLYFFAFAIVLWLMDSFIPLAKDWLYLVSVFLIVVMVLPKIGFLTWKEAHKEISWDIIFLVGGGLAMGTGLKNAGVIAWISSTLSSLIGPIPEVIAILLISFVTGVIGTAVICVISATATAFVPLAIGLALSYGWAPVDFAVTACLSSSLCFLLPANSVSNAMAFGTGYFKNSDLLKCGILQTVMSVIIVAIVEGLIIPLF